jgi:hypothetical protein
MKMQTPISKGCSLFFLSLFRWGDGNVGILRSPVRAITLLDPTKVMHATALKRRRIMCLSKFSFAGYIVVYLLTLAACARNPQIEMHDLVKRASNYHGKMVVVSGCVFRDFELFVMGPCAPANMEESVWITSYSEIEEQSKYGSNVAEGLRKRKGNVSEKDKQMEALFDKIPSGELTKVLLEGEFRFSSTPQYGNNRQWKYLFIVHRVIEIPAQG